MTTNKYTLASSTWPSTCGGCPHNIHLYVHVWGIACSIMCVIGLVSYCVCVNTDLSSTRYVQLDLKVNHLYILHAYVYTNYFLIICDTRYDISYYICILTSYWHQVTSSSRHSHHSRQPHAASFTWNWFHKYTSIHIRRNIALWCLYNNRYFEIHSHSHLFKSLLLFMNIIIKSTLVWFIRS